MAVEKQAGEVYWCGEWTSQYLFARSTLRFWSPFFLQHLFIFMHESYWHLPESVSQNRCGLLKRSHQGDCVLDLLSTYSLPLQFLTTTFLLFARALSSLSSCRLWFPETSSQFCSLYSEPAEELTRIHVFYFWVLLYFGQLIPLFPKKEYSLSQTGSRVRFLIRLHRPPWAKIIFGDF